MSIIKELIKKLLNKEYRDAYVAENVRTWIAYQIRSLREQRNKMSQMELANLMGKKQSVISRLEDPDYGKLTVQTLLDVASAFDVALVVQFVDHATFLTRTADVTASAMEVKSFSKDQIEGIKSFSFIRYSSEKISRADELYSEVESEKILEMGNFMDEGITQYFRIHQLTPQDGHC